jgi:uncharacterized repeat protein (TIGR02543 family)
MRKKLAALFTVFFIALVFAACQGGEAELVSFAVNSETVEEYYSQGSELDLTINAVMSDGSTSPIKVTSEMISGFDPDVLGEQTVTITYKGKSIVITVEVVPGDLALTYVSGENGSITGELVQSVEYQSDGTEVTAVPNTGYEFIGWSDGVINAKRKDRNVVEDISVTANFRLITFTVRFYDRNGDLVETETAGLGGAVTLPDAPDIPGLEFIGWVSRVASQTVDFDNITANVDVIAAYTDSIYTVSFYDGPYDSEPSLIESKTCKWDDSVTPPNITEPYGYTFSGWKTESGMVAVFSGIRTSFACYASFTPVNFTITFDSAGGSTVTPREYPYGVPAGTLPEPTKTGMNLIGWYTEAEEGELFDTTSVVNGDITLYAYWTEKYCSVDFYNYLGGTVIDSKSVKYNSKVTPPSVPTRVGYTFAGWYDLSDSSGSSYNFNNPVMSNKIIYAKWTPISYTVRFFPEGGTTVADVSASYGTTITSPSSTRTGYNLSGWTLNKTTQVLYDFTNTTITGNISLYAVWTEQIITVSASCSAGGSVSPSGTIEIGYFKSVSITITPSEGYEITRMLVNGSINVTPAYSYSLSRTTYSLYVEFKLKTFDITATVKSAGGTLTPLGKTTKNYGESQTYTLTPSSGYFISLVRVNNTVVSGVTSNYYQYTFSNIKANNTIEVYFAPITYQITVSSTPSSGGSITHKGTFYVEYNGSFPSTGQLIATANSDYHIYSVSVNGSYIYLYDGVSAAITSYTYSVTNVTGSMNIAIVFEGDRYTVVPTSGDNGSISPSYVVSKSINEIQTFTITPNTGYHVSALYVDDVNVGALSSYVFSTDEVGEHTIEAEFAINQYTASWYVAGLDNYQINGTTPITHGDLKEFEFTPLTHFHFNSLTLDIGSETYSIPNEDADNSIYSLLIQSGTYVLTIKSVTGNVSLNVSFLIDSYEVLLSAGEGGILNINSSTLVYPETPYESNQSYGTSLVIKVLPDSGYHITSVIRNGVADPNFDPEEDQDYYTFTLNITENQTIVTVFEINTYTITLDVGANGVVTYEGASVTEFEADYEETPQLIILPDTGYEVDIFSVNTYPVTLSDNTYTFNAVMSDIQVNITFTRIIYNIGYGNPSKGIIEWESGEEGVSYDVITQGSMNYLQVPYGDSVIYTFTPDDNCHIDELEVKVAGGSFILLNDGYSDSLWSYSVDGEGVGTLTLFDVSENREISVSYADDLYSVESSVVGGHGTVSPLGIETRGYGGNIIYVISAELGYKLSSIEINGSFIDITGIETVYELINISEDIAIIFRFEIET